MTKAAFVIWAVLGVLAVFFALACLSAAIIFFGWNLGVVGLVAACGGAVSKIGFGTAFFVSIALSVVKSLFSGGAAVASK